MVSEEVWALIQIFVYPGFLFLFLLAFFTEWLDRKMVAKFQSRYGPLHVGPKGILQPIADFVKLLSKEDIIPAMADKAPFRIMPIILLALAITPLFFIPITGSEALVSFEGDLIIVMFIMSIIALLVFIGGWASTSRFSTVGSIRAGLQMFAYEIPLNLAMIGPAVSARSLSISRIVEWQTQGIWGLFIQPIGFAVLTICLMAHLQRVPFDIPEADSEIVSGWIVEFSGKKLALIRLAKDFELVLASSLIVSLFLGGPNGPWYLSPVTFLAKFLLCVFVLSNLRAAFARYRIDQLLSGAWKYLTPLALLQVSIIGVWGF
jgi:NADH-quinone oxidoreductase subunit H